MKERKRERERKRDRQRDTETERHRERGERKRKKRERKRQTDNETETERQRQTDMQTCRHTKTEKGHTTALDPPEPSPTQQSQPQAIPDQTIASSFSTERGVWLLWRSFMKTLLSFFLSSDTKQHSFYLG